VDDEPRRIEELLRERAARQAQDGLFGAPAELELRARLAREAAREVRRRRALVLALPLAAAALLLWLQLARGGADYGAPPAQLALLDATGRELEARARDPGHEPGSEPAPRPRRCLIELAPERDGSAWLFAYDPAGTRTVLPLEQPVALTGGEDRVLEIELGALEPSPSGDSFVSIVAVVSERPIPGSRLLARLPGALDARVDRAEALDELARELTRTLRCTVLVRSALLVSR